MAQAIADAPSEVAPYLDVVRAYEKAASKWTKRAEKIIKRYLDERSDQQQSRAKFNVLWANVETLKPAIYAKTPNPEVERRFLDKDPVGRVASEVLERTIAYYLATTPFGSTMRQARMDYLLTGRGVTWSRYVPQFRQMAAQLTDDSTIGDDEGAENENEAEEKQDDIIEWESVAPDYVHWRDFGHTIARTWEEVTGVWRIVYMTRRQMKKRGFKEWLTVPLDYAPKEMRDSEGDAGKKAAVYEFWDAENRKVYWFTKSHPRFLDVRDDPLGLDKFFPCSEPIYGTLANESLIPVPDYVEYQDQAQELDELTARIIALQKAIKAVGIYDASQPSIARLLNEGLTNQLLPVEGWAALQEKGGINGAMQMLPLKEIAETLIQLYDARDRVKQDLYEITGMSDIIRGATKASETATAQNIKNNYVTLRLSEKQREMQRLARNTIETMGIIICRHFQDETIKTVSGIKLFDSPQHKQAFMAQRQAKAQLDAMMAQRAGQQPQPPEPLPDDVQQMLDDPSWAEVLALLRNNPDRSFRIDIETDSTIEMDADQDKQEAMQFLEAVGGFIKEAVDVPPSIAPLAGAMLEFGVRKWRVGRQLEGVINRTVEELEKAAQNPPQQPPDPALIKVQGEMQLKQQSMQFDQQMQAATLQHQQQIEAIKVQGAAQIEATKAQNMMAIEQMRQQAENARAQQEMANDVLFKRFEALLDARTKIEVAEITAGSALDAAEITAANQATGGE